MCRHNNDRCWEAVGIEEYIRTAHITSNNNHNINKDKKKVFSGHILAFCWCNKLLLPIAGENSLLFFFLCLFVMRVRFGPVRAYSNCYLLFSSCSGYLAWVCFFISIESIEYPRYSHTIAWDANDCMYPNFSEECSNILSIAQTNMHKTTEVGITCSGITWSVNKNNFIGIYPKPFHLIEHVDLLGMNKIWRKEPILYRNQKNVKGVFEVDRFFWWYHPATIFHSHPYHNRGLSLPRSFTRSPDLCIESSRCVCVCPRHPVDDWSFRNCENELILVYYTYDDMQL